MSNQSKPQVTFSGIRKTQGAYGPIRYFKVLVDGEEIGECYHEKDARNWIASADVEWNFGRDVVRGHAHASEMKAALLQRAEQA